MDFFVHFAIMFGIDLITVLRFKNYEYGIDLNSLLKIIGFN